MIHSISEVLDWEFIPLFYGDIKGNELLARRQYVVCDTLMSKFLSFWVYTIIHGIEIIYGVKQNFAFRSTN